MSNQNNDADQVNYGIRAILKNPYTYTYFQRLMGSGSKYKRFIGDFIKPKAKARVLDIGCGSADILEYYPADIDYVGYDLSGEYIDYARKKYKDRGEFHQKRVSEMEFAEDKKFDIVYAGGLIHHLSDDEALGLFKIGKAALKDGGFMFTADPAWAEGRTKLSTYILKRDRGKHIREPDLYKVLAEKVFDNVEQHVLLDVGVPKRPNNLLKCFK